MTVTAADIVAYLASVGQLVRPVDASSESLADVVIESVATPAEAAATEVAWTRRPEAAAQFAGALLLAGDAAPAEPAAGPTAPPSPSTASPSAPATAPPARVAFCRNPRLAMALVVQRFFSHLAADREPRFADPATAALVAANAAWVRNAVVGRNVVIGPGATIGCTGMGFERADDGSLVRFPQLGGVIIEDDVDIAAHATVQRGALGDTTLRRGAKVGPHVNVGHNVDVGEHVLIAGHAQIGGSARIERLAVIWQGATIANGVAVGEGATVGMCAAVRKDVGPGEVWVGNPAQRLR